MLSLQDLQYYTSNLWAKISEKFMTKEEAVNGVLLDPHWEMVDAVQNNNTITLPSLEDFDELYIVMDNGESTVIHQTAIKKESLVSENENVTYREILLDTLYDAETYAIYYPDTNTIVPSVCEGTAIDDTTSITTTVYVKKYNGVDTSNLSANNVSYDNEASELNATNVQNAIDVLDNNLDNISSRLDDIAENLNGDFLSKENPNGTGSLSMNRMTGTNVGNYSTTLGYLGKATGNYSASMGYNTTSEGDYSYSSGINTVATGVASHAEGYYVNANSDYQHVQGKYNIIDSNGDYAHIVGNGTDTSNRSNAYTLDWDGNAWYQSDISFGGDALATTSQTVKGAISEIVSTIGDINAVLDIINGEVV